jgi:hypothetical protein
MKILNSLSPSLFWDVDRDSLKRDIHQQFIIERVLARGDITDVRWALTEYGRESLQVVAESGRGLDQKSAYFWRWYFGNHS